MRKIIIAIATTLVIFSLFTVCAFAEENRTTSPTVSSISISSYPDRTVYGAFEQLDVTGLALRVCFADGTEKIIGGNEIRISYSRDKCFRVGDDSVMLSYGGKSLKLPVTVNRISYDLSALDLAPVSVVYNGSLQSYNKPLPQIVGLDGIPLGISVSGGGMNVGVYDISINFSTVSSDYLLPESRVITMSIEPARADIVWEGLSFVYDGKSKSPMAYYTDTQGTKVYVTVSGAATNAGTGYIAKATLNDPNYEFYNTTASFDIRKADYDFSAVVWSKDSFVYDGTKKSVSASGLPLGVSVIGYSGDRSTDAGIYTATAMLSWDENNYNPPQPLTHVWEIKKADYDMSSISFRSESYVYDGRMHYPTLIGDMPMGADGIMLEYSFSAGACHVADGTVSVVISFHTQSQNYNIPTEKYSSVRITPLGISVKWGEVNLSYTGEKQTPTAYADECAVTVSGGAVTTGRYIATATTDNSDYFIANDKKEFSIIKAQNYWTITPTSSVCYESRDIVLNGQSRFGNISARYYLDKECKNEISTPTACGKYYAILFVSETENYSGLVSEPISFEIVKIVAVSFLVKIEKENIKAFETLSGDDYICTVVNNDGSVDVIDHSLVSICYENGSSFRRKDSVVIFKFEDFVLELPITVDYADYDLSGVKWVNTQQVYDGKERLPRLTGLPEGVEVRDYGDTAPINTGSYKIYANLEYDSENYNKPYIEPCDFIIKKQEISIPLFTAVYNGKYQSALCTSDLYTITAADKYMIVGEYIVAVRLTDSDNYIFSENSSDTAYAIFKITPARIGVKVNDVSLKLFEKLGQVDYTITSGKVYENDVLRVTAYSEGKRVLVKSENQNYVLDVEEGRIKRLPYPTLGGALIMLVISACAGLFCFGSVKAYQNRHQILGAVAIMKCRWFNRGYKAPMPTPNIPEEKTPIDFSDNDTTEVMVEPEEAIDEAIPDENIAMCFEVDAERADTLITDSLAKSLINREGEIIYTSGSEREIINLGDISAAFESGDRVDVNSLKAKHLISAETGYIKILGGGKIDKSLMIYANDFSLSAVKMIALTGGQVTKVVTFKERSRDEKE